MPERKTRNAGLSNFDPQQFMFEVSQEIRAGLKEDQMKAGTAGFSANAPFDQQAQQAIQSQQATQAQPKGKNQK